MLKRAVTVVFGVFFAFALTASSVQADAVHANQFIGQLNATQHRNLDLPDVSRADEQGHLSLVVHSNNGKQLGFSAAAVHSGPRIGLVPRGPRNNVTQNPEPATMILMGTGLVAIGAYVRRWRKT